MSYVSRYELRLAYEDCIRRKHNTDNAVNFEIDDNEKIESLYYELNTMTYTIGKSIVFTLLDIKGHAYREVFAAEFKDRIVHHLLVNRLIDYMNKYDLIDDNYACRKEKGTLYGAKRCQYKLIQCSNNGKEKNTTIIKGDFKNFFNSLNKEMIYNKLEKFIIQYMSDDRNMIFNLYLCKLIVMHCPQHDGNYIRKQPLRFWNGLPEHKCMFNCDDNHSIAVGNLTSQIFANFYLSLFDHYIVDILGYKYYGRYVDDWYIITNDIDNIGTNYRKIREFANSMDLTINVEKSFSAMKSFNAFNSYYLIYDQVKPDISLNDNKDNAKKGKFIIEIIISYDENVNFYTVLQIGFHQIFLKYGSSFVNHDPGA